MKIWVAGGSGMLAAHLIRLLTEQGLPFVANGKDVVDITDEAAVAAFVKDQKITLIINCAAYTQVDKAESEADEAYRVNALGPEIIGKAASQVHARVIHISTDYVFDGKSRSPYHEEDVCAPLGIYGRTKLEGEKNLLRVCPQACIIRTSWLYGWPGKNFVGTMLRLMQERELLRVVNDQVGCPTYCQDLAEAILQMSNQSGIFHFVNSHQTSWYEFAKEIHRQAVTLGYALKVRNIEAIKTEEYPTLAKRPLYSTLSTEKISAVLGKKPRPWQEALEDYLRISYGSSCKTCS